jgi:hypothetical protein
MLTSYPVHPGRCDQSLGNRHPACAHVGDADGLTFETVIFWMGCPPAPRFHKCSPDTRCKDFRLIPCASGCKRLHTWQENGIS